MAGEGWGRKPSAAADRDGSRQTDGDGDGGQKLRVLQRAQRQKEAEWTVWLDRDRK